MQPKPHALKYSSLGLRRRLARHRVVVWFVILLAGTLGSRGQIDPLRRDVIQVGYNQPLRGKSPLSGYAFYYRNRPEFYRTNWTLRLALAPIYIDGELGFSDLLGPETDLGVGVHGGGFADSYSEIRKGSFVEEESFPGHGGGASVSVYHLFNPGRMIPLHGVFRMEGHYAHYGKDRDTADDFEVPDDQLEGRLRAGFRFGGIEPLLLPKLAMELSVWYEGVHRSAPGFYGFEGDRELNSHAHLFWARGLLVYTLPELNHRLNVNLTMGTSLNADRFSAYRLGGVLPLVGEFPLNLPGYYFQEISAESFVLIGAGYELPLGPSKGWALTAQGATAVVDYASGTGQAGNWHSGVGGGVVYRSREGAWQMLAGYAYGVDAIRGTRRGGHSLGVLVQFDLARARRNMFEQGLDPNQSRWLDRILDQIFR